jgi:hypothetical protein
MLTQGVTTEITNADGAGPIDLRTPAERAARGGLAVDPAVIRVTVPQR